MTDRLLTLADSADVVQTLYDYARGLDTKDWTLWRSIFADEVSAKFRAAAETAFIGLGQDWVTMSADDWVEGRRELFSGLATTQHQMTNPTVAIDGDQAMCTMYMQAIHFLPGEPANEYTLGGYYVDTLVRASDGWKITHVNLNVTWERGDSTVLDRARELGRTSSAAMKGSR